MVEAKRQTPPLAPWRVQHLLLAPHRLGFFLAMVVLVASGLWWALVQWDRLSGLVGLHYAVSPSQVHALVMVYGFMPLFFSGFLFTAGPKWLDVEPPSTTRLRGPLLLQAAAWVAWLVTAHVDARAALGAVLLALGGLVWMSAMFWRMLRASRAPDRRHAVLIALALGLCSAGLAGSAAGLALSAWDLGHAFLLTGLWGGVAAVFLVVAHRMLPFFTASALPAVAAWRPFWVLGPMLGGAGLEIVALWLPLLPGMSPQWLQRWHMVHGALAVALGVGMVLLSLRWGFLRSLSNRLLAMLHVGFAWYGVALLLAGLTHASASGEGAAFLPLGALHALTIGCLSSLVLAMVTRVSTGHSGRPLLVDALVWRIFIVLQVAAVLRLVASAWSAGAAWLLPLVALLWVAVVLPWALRLGRWYGCVRSDGRAG